MDVTTGVISPTKIRVPPARSRADCFAKNRLPRRPAGMTPPKTRVDGSPEKLGDDRNDSECRHCGHPLIFKGKGAVCATEAIRLILTRAIYLPKYKRSNIPMLIALSGKIHPPRNDAFSREVSSSPGYQGDGSPEHQGGFRNGIKFKKNLCEPLSPLFYPLWLIFFHSLVAQSLIAQSPIA